MQHLGAQVLATTPNYLRLIAQFQSGVPHDFLAFRNVNWYDAGADNMMALWLETHGTARLARLADSMPCAKVIAVRFAAVHGRLDILEVIHDRCGVAALETSPALFDLAATRGDLAMVQFLHRVGYTGDRKSAARSAVKNGHFPVLKFFWGVSSTTELRGAICRSDMQERVTNNDAVMVQWLVDVWYPAVDPDDLEKVLVESLRTATLRAHDTLTHWLVSKVQTIPRGQFEIVRIFMWSGQLLPYVDADAKFSTDDWRNLIVGMGDSVIPHLTMLFDTLRCLQVGSSTRRDQLIQCLKGAMGCGMLNIVQWLVETQAMDAADARHVFATVPMTGVPRLSAVLGRPDFKAMAELIITYNIQLERAFMLSVVSDYILKTKVVDFDALRVQNEFPVVRFVDAMAKEEGSDAAVVGRCLQYLLQDSLLTLTQRRKVYRLWLTMTKDDTQALAKKRSIEAEMLDEATREDRSTIVEWLTSETTAGTLHAEAAGCPTRRLRKR